jgi:hypothetical protein
MNHDGIQADKPELHPERAAGIQAEKPAPPWERPGCFRLDCGPHRGELLWWLGYAGFAFGPSALFLGTFVSVRRTTSYSAE